MWELESATPAAAKGWANFLFTSPDLATIKEWSAAGVGPSLLHVRDVFFAGAALRPDWEAAWAATFSSLKPLLASGAAFGVFLGDELAWGCIPLSNISTAAAAARLDIPRGTGIVY